MKHPWVFGFSRDFPDIFLIWWPSIGAIHCSTSRARRKPWRKRWARRCPKRALSWRKRRAATGHGDSQNYSLVDGLICWDLSLLMLVIVGTYLAARLIHKIKTTFIYGIMKTNSNVTCQPTRIMRWDRSILSGSHGDMVNSSIQHGFICNLFLSL